MSNEKRRVPWYLWPFWALWRLLSIILELTGRLIAAVIGLVLIIVGIILVVTVILSPVGIALIALGLLLVVRGFFFAPEGGPQRPRIKEAPLFCVVPLCVTAAGCIVLFFLADEIYRLLQPIAGLS